MTIQTKLLTGLFFLLASCGNSTSTSSDTLSTLTSSTISSTTQGFGQPTTIPRTDLAEADDTGSTTVSSTLESTTSSSVPKDEDVLFSANFDSVEGATTAEQLTSQFKGAQHLGGESFLSFGNGYMTQRYEPTNEGSQVVHFVEKDFPSADELYLSYDLFFENGWEWVLGGKLPGLAGGTRPSGGGGGDGTDGFTARLMWGPNGSLIVYAYHANRPSKYGEGFTINETLEPNRWYTITQRVKINSLNTPNGEVEIWIDGKQRLLKTDIMWRTTGEFHVDSLLYSSFYGGHTPEWAPSKTTYARYDNFKVSKNPPAEIAPK